MDVGREITVYYPGQRRFAPDLMVIFDVPDKRRRRYVVQEEGRGLDFVLEVHDGGDRKEDAEFNVARYASLGIPEYFIFDIPAHRLLGHRLESPAARACVPIVPQAGRWPSRVLDLDLALEDDRGRFYRGNAQLKLTSELAAILSENVDHLQARIAAESRAREAAEAELARLRAELEALRR